METERDKVKRKREREKCEKTKGDSYEQKMAEELKVL